MVDFNSPQYRKQLAEQQAAQAVKPLRHMTIGEPTEPIERVGGTTAERLSQPNEAEVARRTVQEIRESTVKITGNAKTRIEILANIGRVEREVVVGGYTFTLRTLKAKETREVSLQTFNANYTTMEASYESRRQQLARAISKIDGQDIDLVLGDRSIEGRIAFIEELEDTLVSRLFDEFLLLKEEAHKQFGISTEAEAKEVSEDLKKA